MKSSKVFWGIFFILAAVYVVVSKFGILPNISIVRIGVTLLLVWMFVEGVRRVDFFGILFSIAFLCIVYDKPLGITELTPWTVLGAALFGSIGLTLIFGSYKKNKRLKNMQNAAEYAGSSSEQCTGERLKVENRFGTAMRYINSDNFKSAELENNFGSLSVYFDNAIIQEGSAMVNVENDFGETNLYIPKEWQVRSHLERSFGAVNEIGSSEGSSSTVLFLNGSTSFGEINIRYI